MVDGLVSFGGRAWNETRRFAGLDRPVGVERGDQRVDGEEIPRFVAAEWREWYRRWMDSGGSESSEWRVASGGPTSLGPALVKAGRGSLCRLAFAARGRTVTSFGASGYHLTSEEVDLLGKSVRWDGDRRSGGVK